MTSNGLVMSYSGRTQSPDCISDPRDPQCMDALPKEGFADLLVAVVLFAPPLEAWIRYSLGCPINSSESGRARFFPLPSQFPHHPPGKGRAQQGAGGHPRPEERRFCFIIFTGPADVVWLSSNSTSHQLATVARGAERGARSTARSSVQSSLNFP